MGKFKPNLIPNFSDGSENIESIIKRNGGLIKYSVFRKKDGVRLEIIDGKLLPRSLKDIRSNDVKSRFKELVDICQLHDIVLEGEFYSHGMSFNEIYRFYSSTNVASDSEKKKLDKYSQQVSIDGKWVTVENPKFEETRLYQEYGGRSIDFLTTFQDSLEFWMFDGFIKGKEHLPFINRMADIYFILNQYDIPFFKDIFHSRVMFTDKEKLSDIFDSVIEEGYEGLVLVHDFHQYQFGRTTLRRGTLLKMKDDNHTFDGIVLDVLEGTMIKEGVERTVNELGNSRTSGKKEDREPNGKAKGFLCEYNGEEFVVSLKGFNDADKAELLKNKDKIIGRHFYYTAMEVLKNVPRHARFSGWRDSK